MREAERGGGPGGGGKGARGRESALQVHRTVPKRCGECWGPWSGSSAGGQACQLRVCVRPRPLRPCARRASSRRRRRAVAGCSPAPTGSFLRAPSIPGSAHRCMAVGIGGREGCACAQLNDSARCVILPPAICAGRRDCHCHARDARACGPGHAPPARPCGREPRVYTLHVSGGACGALAGAVRAQAGSMIFGVLHRHIEFPEPSALDQEWLTLHQPKLQKALKAASLGMCTCAPPVWLCAPQRAFSARRQPTPPPLSLSQRHFLWKRGLRFFAGHSPRF